MKIECKREIIYQYGYATSQELLYNFDYYYRLTDTAVDLVEAIGGQVLHMIKPSTVKMSGREIGHKVEGLEFDVIEEIRKNAVTHRSDLEDS